CARRLEFGDGAVRRSELRDAYRDQDRHPTAGLCHCGHASGGAGGDPAAPDKSNRHRRNSAEGDTLEEAGPRLTLQDCGHSHGVLLCWRTDARSQPELPLASALGDEFSLSDCAFRWHASCRYDDKQKLRTLPLHGQLQGEQLPPCSSTIVCWPAAVQHVLSSSPKVAVPSSLSAVSGRDCSYQRLGPNDVH